MIPLEDENPTQLPPYVTVRLIALNAVAWLWVESAGFHPDLLAPAVCRYGMIPAEITHLSPQALSPRMLHGPSGGATLSTGGPTSDSTRSGDVRQ